MAGTEPALLIVGAIAKPHGIKGEMSVRVETDHPDAVFRPGRVLQLGDADGKPTGGALTVERARPFKGGLLLKVAEHPGRTDALDALRGATLLAEVSALAALEEDEVFLHQLIGLRVIADGAEVGRVREVYDAPSGTLLGVERAGRRELLVPFVRDMLKRIDVAEGILELDAPPGLLEL
jgi:16S rRNA processing protein RimM